MIKLYREEHSPAADGIEAEFQALVLGYERILLSTEEAQTTFRGRSLPVVMDNERVVSGDAIAAYLREMEGLVHDWQLFQNHCCVVGDDEDE